MTQVCCRHWVCPRSPWELGCGWYRELLSAAVSFFFQDGPFFGFICSCMLEVLFNFLAVWKNVTSTIRTCSWVPVHGGGSSTAMCCPLQRFFSRLLADMVSGQFGVIQVGELCSVCSMSKDVCLVYLGIKRYRHWTFFLQRECLLQEVLKLTVKYLHLSVLCFVGFFCALSCI